MDTHYQFHTSINAAPLKGDMSVLFSGIGEPLPGHFIGPAVHGYYLIHIVLNGEGVFETLGERYPLKAGDAFVIFPDILVKYEASFTRPWKYMWCAFSGEIADEVLSSIGITPDRAVLHGCSLPALESLFRNMRSSLERTDLPQLGNMEVSGLLRLVLKELGMIRQAKLEDSSTEHSHSYRQVDQAMRLLSLQYAQNLSIESIAHTLGYHRAHLTKLFKEVTGQSPMQYLFKVRMKKAEELLAGSDLSIAQVAASVGYNDPLFFTKQFRKWSGMSPTAFRRGTGMK